MGNGNGIRWHWYGQMVRPRTNWARNKQIHNYHSILCWLPMTYHRNQYCIHSTIQHSLIMQWTESWPLRMLCTRHHYFRTPMARHTWHTTMPGCQQQHRRESWQRYQENHRQNQTYRSPLISAPPTQTTSNAQSWSTDNRLLFRDYRLCTSTHRSVDAPIWTTSDVIRRPSYPRTWIRSRHPLWHFKKNH